MSNPTVQAIRLVGFEDLGSFAPAFANAGYQIDYADAATLDLRSVEPLAADIVVVLGGPIGVGDHATYPVILQMIELLNIRLAANRPTLGVCLGAQLMAAALGARVYAGSAKEIGWGPLQLTGEGRTSPLVALDAVPVLHWHGDTFDMPEGCELLASTGICHHQAFARGPNVLGLQFHAEPLANQFGHWLIGHACELAGARIDPNALRADAARYGAGLEALAETMVSRWLDQLIV